MQWENETIFTLFKTLYVVVKAHTQRGKETIVPLFKTLELVIKAHAQCGQETVFSCLECPILTFIRAKDKTAMAHC